MNIRQNFKKMRGCSCSRTWIAEQIKLDDDTMGSTGVAVREGYCTDAMSLESKYSFQAER